MNKIDWHYLLRPILILISTILMSLSIAYGGYYLETKTYSDYQQSVATLKITHNLYKNMVKDIDLQEQYRNKFSEYQSSGLVGKERRLSWIESLESTNQVLQLPTLTYNLMPQEEFIRPGFKAEKSVEVKSSPMEISMGILQEEDVFAVLEGLRLSINSLFTLDSCKFKRMSAIEQSFETKRANITADCLIRWVTINAK
ncbi:MAG: hypothetical protein GY784_07800 [Gammaproteobacteria bacterium]|nr:hypothetical protein [Gammaproteobacteria bacterium]